MLQPLPEIRGRGCEPYGGGVALALNLVVDRDGMAGARETEMPNVEAGALFTLHFAPTGQKPAHTSRTIAEKGLGVSRISPRPSPWARGGVWGEAGGVRQGRPLLSSHLF